MRANNNNNNDCSITLLDLNASVNELWRIKGDKSIFIKSEYIKRKIFIYLSKEEILSSSSFPWRKIILRGKRPRSATCEWGDMWGVAGRGHSLAGRLTSLHCWEELGWELEGEFRQVLGDPVTGPCFLVIVRPVDTVDIGAFWVSVAQKKASQPHRHRARL